MRMHPVSPALFERKIITRRFARRDRILRDKRNAVHEVWQNESVPMKARRDLKLVHHFHVKSFVLFWRIPLAAIGLFDGDDGYRFSKDFKRNFLYEETHGF